MPEQATTIDARQDRIIRELNRLEDGFEKYEYLISLGKALPEPDEDLMADRYAMKGCQSKVWLRGRLNEGALHFSAHSDSVITCGMISLLLQALDGAAPEEIAAADLYFIEQTGLDTNLSPARANGLKTIAGHMQGLARDCL